MGTQRELPPITDEGLEEFFSANFAVLVVTLTTCAACAAYEADVVNHLPAAGLDGVALGKAVLDGPGLTRFRRANPWLGDLDFLPYTLLYSRGVPLEEFASCHAAYLLERLRHVAAGPA